jgi:hypothetical protein
MFLLSAELKQTSDFVPVLKAMKDEIKAIKAEMLAKKESTQNQ